MLSGPSTSKRQKVEVGWNVLRDVLSNGQETPALLAWYDIFLCVFIMNLFIKRLWPAWYILKNNSWKLNIEFMRKKQINITNLIETKSGNQLVKILAIKLLKITFQRKYFTSVLLSKTFDYFLYSVTRSRNNLVYLYDKGLFECLLDIPCMTDGKCYF